MSEENQIDLDSFNLDDAPEPPRLPKGDYNARLLSIEEGTSSQKGTPYRKFHFEIIEVNEIFDEDFSGDEAEFVGKRISSDSFWLSPKALFNLRRFANGMGATTSNITVTQLLSELNDMTGDEFTIRVARPFVEDANGNRRLNDDGEPITRAVVSRVVAT